MAPVVPFEPHSTARTSLEPSASLSTNPNFPAVKIFSNVSQVAQVAAVVVLVCLYRYFRSSTAPVPRHIAPSKDALRLHPAGAAPS